MGKSKGPSPLDLMGGRGEKGNVAFAASQQGHALAQRLTKAADATDATDQVSGHLAWRALGILDPIKFYLAISLHSSLEKRDSLPWSCDVCVGTVIPLNCHLLLT